MDVEPGGVGCECGRSPQVVVPEGAPPKSPDPKEGELRLEVKWVCCVRWREVPKGKCGGLPVVCHDGYWNDTTVNVLGEDWMNDGAPVKCGVPGSPGCVCVGAVMSRMGSAAVVVVPSGARRHR